MFRTVHLEGLRCDGEYHDGCDALCLLYWKEAWLRRIDGKDNCAAPVRQKRVTDRGIANTEKAGCTLVSIMSSTKIQMIRARRDITAGYRSPESELGVEKVGCTAILQGSAFRQHRFKGICQMDPIAILNWAHQENPRRENLSIIDMRLCNGTRLPMSH